MKKRITEDRISWMQSICDLRIGYNIKGLSEAEGRIAAAIYNKIPQYRSAARSISKSRYYRRCHVDYTASLYWYDGETLHLIAKTTKHRINNILKAHQAYISGETDIHPDIWENYCRGGYMTRRGLRAAYSEHTIARTGNIAMSHMICTDSGKEAHNYRVSIR